MAEEVKKFTFTHTIDCFDQFSDYTSEEKTFFNVPWAVLIQGADKEDPKINAGVYLLCKKERGSNLWSIHASAKITLQSSSKKENINVEKGVFNSKEDGIGEDLVWNQEDMNTFCKDREIHVTCEVTIYKMIGIRQKRKIDFDCEDGIMTDVVLDVKGRKFYVSRVMLSSFSPVFRSMLTGPFKETKKKTISITDVDADSFDTFLKLIYSCDSVIDENNVEALLILADKYDVQSIETKCEKFLMNSYELETAEKLRLAEKYSLSDLQKKYLDQLNSAKDVKDLKVGVNNVGELTVKALYEKLIQFA